jgi:hypothetical protein
MTHIMTVRQKARIMHGAILFAVVASTATAQMTTTSQNSPFKAGIAKFDAESLEQAKATLTPPAKAGDAEGLARQTQVGQPSSPKEAV